MAEEAFDAVIVGSGFGGSVMAYRLAQEGLRVCLLERGKAFPPGSFPRTPAGMRRNFWDPSEGYHGMFDVWSFRHIEAVVASGLGGGSLIYANVLIRKPEKWFVRQGFRDGSYEYWPVTREELEPHYDAVEHILQPQRYPMNHPPYNRTQKTLALKAAGEALGVPWELPNLAVTFANSGREPVPGELIVGGHDNLHGRERSTCRLCGECDVGCNYGSKNTLDYNYLSRAQKAGAEIRTRHEVRGMAPAAGGGYRIDYVSHEGAEEGKKRTGDLPIRTMTARRLILSAGALGTPYLLLKHRERFPALSPMLGTRFGGNGDLLSFVFRCREEVDGERRGRPIDASFGPVITSTLCGADDLDGGPGAGGPGYFLQDAGYPAFVSWLVEVSDAGGWLRRLGLFAKRRVEGWLTGDPRSDLSGEFRRLFGDCELSDGSMPLLGMGRDEADGRMSLRGSRDGQRYLDVDWKIDRSQAHFRRVEAVSRKVAEHLGGDFRLNPLTSFLERVITVHPLGGCPMGRNPNEGVVDANGEVFGHPGLYVADGSVMPGPVGPNPSLTIAALSNRFAEGIILAHERERAGKGT